MTVKTPALAAKEFRAELVKIMPGYVWTVHKSSSAGRLVASGILSSGFNRLSTLRVTRREQDGRVTYEAKSAGFGTRALFRHTNVDGTLARALRGLQQYYERQAAAYAALAAPLRRCRQPEGES